MSRFRPPADSPEQAAAVAEASDWVLERWDQRPFAGVVLGSGLGGLVDSIDVQGRYDFEHIPHFARPTAEGHAGTLLTGYMGPVPLLAFQGRLHRYEGHPPDVVTFGIRVLRALGARVLVLSNAAGGIDPAYKRADVMIVDDHLDLTSGDPLQRLFRFDAPTEAANCYDAQLSQWAWENAHRDGRPVHRGCYVAMTGPNYETRAEYELLRKMDIGTVGMSTAPEAAVARRVGLRVLALSAITNECDPASLTVTTHDDVQQAAAEAGRHIIEIVREVITQAFTAAVRGEPPQPLPDRR